jgi:hypothetical protein
VRPRCRGPKGAGGAKFFKSELLTGGRLVLSIKPPCSPARIVLRRPQIEVFDFGVHRAAKTAGLIVERAPNNKDSPPERLMGFDPQEAFTQHDEARYVQDSVGIQIVELNPVSKKEPVEEKKTLVEGKQGRVPGIL